MGGLLVHRDSGPGMQPPPTQVQPNPRRELAGALPCPALPCMQARALLAPPAAQGTTSKTAVCETCGLKLAECSGHFGEQPRHLPCPGPSCGGLVGRAGSPALACGFELARCEPLALFCWASASRSCTCLCVGLRPPELELPTPLA